MFTDKEVHHAIGDHFDGLADALRAAEKRGINCATVMIEGMKELAGEADLSSRDIAIHLTGFAREMIKNQLVGEMATRLANEYMARFEHYLKTLPQAAQNDMRLDLDFSFRQALLK